MIGKSRYSLPMGDARSNLKNGAEKSGEEQVAKPHISTSDGRAIWRVVQEFEKSQWWSPSNLYTAQLRGLGQLLSHAQKTVPYYKTKLGGELALDAPLTAEQWTEIPQLRRAEISEAGVELYSDALPKSHGAISYIHTSGTTGQPIRVRRSGRTALFWSAFTLRDHLWHQRDFTQKLAALRHAGDGQDPYPQGTRSKTWGPSGKVFKTGPAVSLNINCSLEQQMEWLKREEPGYLLTHPTVVLALANHCIRTGETLPGLRQVQTLSEVLRDDVREACRAAWGVSMSDNYSSREVGYMALQCPNFDHYHVQAEGVFLEVLGDDGKSCQPGEIGRVVVTPLQNYSMPLLRYEIGDYAEVGGICPCGRGLPVLNRILGRDQNMLTLPNGERRWTLLSSDDIGRFLEIAPIRQYQFVQTSPGDIEARLACARGLSDEEEVRITNWLAEKFGFAFDVTFIYMPEIPRTAAGKFQDFISEVDVGGSHQGSDGDSRK